MMDGAENPRDRPDVLVHAGFHKTGTSTLQTFLKVNEALLSDHFRFCGKDDFRGAGAAARRYGQRPFPWRLRHFRRSFRRFLADLPDDRPLVLSRETFSGIMPGHRRIWRPVKSYDRAAPALARAIAAELKARFGPGTSIAFLYTTRERQSWLRSVYGHLLRSIRLTDDFRAFRSRIDGPPLAEEAEAIRHALGDIPVHIAPLERHARAPGGPAEAVLDIMGVPPARRERLTPVGRVNPGHPIGVLEQFLALNRSMPKGTVLRSAKEAILKQEAPNG